MNLEISIHVGLIKITINFDRLKIADQTSLHISSPSPSSNLLGFATYSTLYKRDPLG